MFLLYLLLVKSHNTKKYIDQEPPYLMRQICVLYFPFNFCGGTGFVYIPPIVYST